jgi:hypothetical protein
MLVLYTVSVAFLGLYLRMLNSHPPNLMHRFAIWEYLRINQAKCYVAVIPEITRVNWGSARSGPTLGPAHFEYHSSDIIASVYISVYWVKRGNLWMGRSTVLLFTKTTTWCPKHNVLFWNLTVCGNNMKCSATRFTFVWYVHNWTHEDMGAPACTVVGEGVPNLVQPTMDTTVVTSLLLLHSFCLQLWLFSLAFDNPEPLLSSLW